MTTVYLVRHCEAEGNVNGYFQGHFNGEITETGRLQLLKLAKRFEKVSMEAAYSSDLKRAYLTTKAAVGRRNINVICDRRLREINGGGYENKRWEDLPKLFPKEYELWCTQPHLCTTPDGEKMTDCRDRMMDVILEKVRIHKGQSIIMGSHGCAIHTVTCVLLGWDFSRLAEVPWCGNTAVTTVEFDDHQNVVSIDIADNSHLNGERFFLKF